MNAEFPAFMTCVDLDGADGLAKIDVRFTVPADEARRLSRWMLESGYPLRVFVPDSTGKSKAMCIHGEGCRECYDEAL